MLSSPLAAMMTVSALLISGTFAAAQNAPADRSNQTIQHKEGEWRASKLNGIDVYNDANEKIGDIDELIVDKSGKIELVVLSVGGFLGMGEHSVAIPFDKLKWANEPVRSTTTTTTNSPPGTVVRENRTARPVRAADEKWYPDHAIFNATKDQLKAMPQFKY